MTARERRTTRLGPAILGPMTVAPAAEVPDGDVAFHVTSCPNRNDLDHVSSAAATTVPRFDQPDPSIGVPAIRSAGLWATRG